MPKPLHVVHGSSPTRPPALNCERRIDPDAAVATLAWIISARGRPPQFIPCDNRPGDDRERTAGLMPLFWRGSRLHRSRIAVAERTRRVLRLSCPAELLSVELLSCLAEARVMVEDWREDPQPPPAHGCRT